jgi:hypothetical protein
VTEGSAAMRSMWLVIDDTDGFDSPVGWEDTPTVTVTDYTYAPLDEADEVYGEAPEGDLYVGRHRGEIED